MEGRNVVIWLTLIVVSLFLTFAFISAFSPMHYYGAMGPWMMGFGWMWMPLIWIIFLALIGVGLYLLITGSEAQRDRALEIARERYARGEIIKEEFDRIKRDLKYDSMAVRNGVSKDLSWPRPNRDLLIRLHWVFHLGMLGFGIASI